MTASSLIYDSFADDLSAGNIVPATDTFYLMLVTSAYTPNKATHTKRSDVTNEVTGVGYTSGGAAVTCTVAKDAVNHRETYTFGTVDFAASTLTARGAVIYKRRGGLATADELVASITFAADQSTVNAIFRVTFATALTLQN